MTFVKKNEGRSKSLFAPFMSIVVLFVLIAVSCKDEEDPIVLNSPAYYIDEANKKFASLPSTTVSAIAPSNQGEVVTTLYATGVQKYKAVASANSTTGYVWASASTPQAYLFDNTNAQVGTHGAGPVWKLSANDVINASLVAGIDSPDGSANIKWLLLAPASGTTPSGVFAQVKYIQRIVTVGGIACSTLPADATSTCESDYKAVYIFRK